MSVMKQDVFNQTLIDFLSESVTPFHATQTLARILRGAGFSQLNESDAWNLKANARYYVTRNDSSIIAFTTGDEKYLDHGFKIAGAHTDSPCLKVKPQPEKHTKGYFQLGVEVYGGALLNPWFDRDLSLAGRASFVNSRGQLDSILLDFKRAIAMVPSLAIHLDREANKNRTVNPQQHLPPILTQLKADQTLDFRQLLLGHIQQENPELDITKVLDFELSFYDTQPPALIGLESEFLASARLDNLLSCFVILQSLLDADDSMPTMMVCNDHEEVGSRSSCGAMGPMLQDVLQRIVGTGEDLTRVVDRSMLVSADNAHGVHPNYVDKHDGNHGPILNHGPVIKINANQSYATSSITAARFRHLCELVNVPVQAFVTRTDMGCGSTIGPITSANLGIEALDVGVPTFGMHSVRELAGTSDAFYLYKVLRQFFSTDV